MEHIVSLNGINVHPFSSFDDIINYINDKKGILIAINAEKILHATDEFRKLVNNNIGYADGFGAVLALKKKGCKNAVKTPGCELWLKIVNSYYKSKSFYLIGGSQNVIENTVSKLKKEYAGIQIVGYRNGYLKNDEETTLIQEIKSKKPDIVFVAMGSPKQEFLMEKLIETTPAIYQGLGGSFDVYTGTVKRAPKWWVNHNLEWEYRLIKQPSRIKRQIHLFRFLYMLILDKL